MTTQHRTNKRLLAEQIRYLIGLGMKPGAISKALNKSPKRIFQIRRLFDLPEWTRKSETARVD